ncbi:MAG: choice-of-anchor Q domain-containing protein [Verrucomicrobiia bacterium]
MNARQISARRFLVGKISIAAACLVLSGVVPASVRAQTITVTSCNDSGPGTLRAALATAANGDIIDLTTLFCNVVLGSGQLLVSNSVSIVGPGASFVAIVNTNPSSRAFYVSSNTTVTISGLTITQGKVTGSLSGGGVYNDHATLTVSNCTLMGNSAGFNGGGLFNASGTLTVIASTLSNNSIASGNGGGICNSNGMLTVTNSTLSDNEAGSTSGGNGGGISNTNGTLTVNGSTFNGNVAFGYCFAGGGFNANLGWGGGIFNQGTMTVTSCSFSGNEAGYVGGGIVNYATGTVSTCILSSNLSTWAGGIDNYISGLLTVTNCTVNGNSTIADCTGSGSGGGIDNENAMTVQDCTLSGNSSTNYGGGVVNFGTLTVSASTLVGNSAALSGSGIYNTGSFTTLAISNSTISGNSAALLGGGILNTNGTLTVIACTLSGNSAQNGGGILSVGSTARIEIGNTILNAGVSGENITNGPGSTPRSLGYNLSSDAAGGDEESTGPGGLLDATGDIRNTDPILGPLANNGGPTPTHALMPGSPATDQGKSFGLTTDQRGLSRPVVDPCIAKPPGGDGSDIGAFEEQLTCRTVLFEATAIRQIGISKDLRLTFPTLLGSNYVVQTRSNMVSGSWTSLPGTNVGIGVVMQYIVTNALAVPQGFYRIQQSP